MSGHDYDVIVVVVYTDPQAAAVGAIEAPFTAGRWRPDPRSAILWS